MVIGDLAGAETHREQLALKFSNVVSRIRLPVAG